MFKTILFITLAFNILSASPILDDFRSKGYHEMANDQFGQPHFETIYSQLDAFIDFIDQHPQWAQKLYDIDQEFAQSEANSPFGSPPMGYIDETKSGKSKKSYFHFTQPYLDHLSQNHPEMIDDTKELQELTNSLKTISDYSQKKFNDVIESIELSNVMQTDKAPLLTLIKVVRYEPSEFPASNPHFDFSGLSFLFDNSEPAESESLLIAPYKENLTVEDFSAPNRMIKKSRNQSSLLLIPGLALKQLEIPIPPTPHAVKQQNKQRYAIIVFAMVPNVNLTYDEIKLRQIKLPKL
jgi:hypothetical protein